MEENKEVKVNPYWDKIFGEWFKNIVVLLVLLSGIILLYFGLNKNWIGKDFGIELIFLIIGLIIGKRFENGKG